MMSLMLEDPLCFLAFCLLLLYLQDLVSFLIRRSTDNIRKYHYWVENVDSKYSRSKKFSIVQLSEAYLPGWLIIIGNFPRYLNTALLIVAIRFLPAGWAFWMLMLVVASLSVLEYLVSQILKSWCRRRNIQ